MQAIFNFLCLSFLAKERCETNLIKGTLQAITNNYEGKAEKGVKVRGEAGGASRANLFLKFLSFFNRIFSQEMLQKFRKNLIRERAKGER